MTPDEAFAQMVAEGDSVLDKLDECARTVPGKVFIHYGEDGVKLTFAEFKHRTDRIAAGLVAMGVTEGIPVSADCVCDLSTVDRSAPLVSRYW